MIQKKSQYNLSVRPQKKATKMDFHINCSSNVWMYDVLSSGTINKMSKLLILKSNKAPFH